MILFLASGCVFHGDFASSTTWYEIVTGMTGDTGVPEEVPIRVTELAWGCDDENTAWTWTTRTDGWVGAAWLNVFRTADDEAEEHPMALLASDPDGNWDERRTGPLPDGVDAADQASGVDTRFDCVGDADTLSFVIRLADEGGELLDCVIWGQDPEGATARIRALDPAILELGGCRAWED